MTLRRPRFKKQIGDPTTSLDGYLCTMESGAMALDVITNGRVNVWGGQLVPYCGRTPSQIIAKGTNLGNVRLAWQHWHQYLDIRTNSAGSSWSKVMQDLRNHYWVILQGDYDQFSLYTRCQDSFTGDHAVLMGPEFTNTPNGLAILVADPLCGTFRFTPESELRKYAEKLGRKNYSNWKGQVFYARIPASIAPIPGAAPHYEATVISNTALYNPRTKRWVYNGKNAIKVGKKLEVRSARYNIGGQSCYPVVKPYIGYYVPYDNVKLGKKL